MSKKRNKYFNINIETINTGINTNIGKRIFKVMGLIKSKNFLLLNMSPQPPLLSLYAVHMFYHKVFGKIILRIKKYRCCQSKKGRPIPNLLTNWLRTIKLNFQSYWNFINALSLTIRWKQACMKWIKVIRLPRF